VTTLITAAKETTVVRVFQITQNLVISRLSLCIAEQRNVHKCLMCTAFVLFILFDRWRPLSY